MPTIYDSTIPQPKHGVINSQGAKRSVNTAQIVHTRTFFYKGAAMHFANTTSTPARLRARSPLAELGPLSAQVCAFLQQFPDIEAILPEAVTQTRHFFAGAVLSLELDESLSKPVLLLVCKTHLDAISALDARQELMETWWLKLPVELDARFDFHLKFAAKEIKAV